MVRKMYNIKMNPEEIYRAGCGMVYISQNTKL
jgi:hypothetical protein